MVLALLGGTVIGLDDSCTLTLDNLIFKGGATNQNTAVGWACPPISEFVRGKAFFGDLLALIGAWAVAGYLIIGRRLRAGISLVPYIFVVYGSAAISLLLAMLASGESPGGYSPSVYLWIMLLALVPQLLGHTTYNWALRYLPAALVSITTLAEPVGSAFLAYLILDEALTPLTALGGVLILAGIYLAAGTKSIN
jgi:drug/metabolite transporter (DMT)-like permease